MARFWNRKKQEQPVEKEERSYGNSFALPYSGKTDAVANSALRLSTVYRCVEVISSSVAQLPISLYKVDDEGYNTKDRKHSVAILLGTEPNEFMTRYNFMKVIVSTILLKGNAYALIKRDKINQFPTELELLSNDRIEFEAGKYKLDGKPVNSSNILHFLNHSYDGMNGISVLQHARNTINLSTNSEAHASGFFKNGANVSGILTVEGSLSQTQKDDIKESWVNTFDPVTGTPNGIAVLEGNMDFSPISINPSDAQLLETREFNVVDICRFFGVSPVKAFDLTKSSYSTVEASQLAFLTDTLSPLMENIELELERKLLLPSERMNYDIQFDEEALLRVDKNSLAEYYSKIFTIGVIKINEVRKQLNLPKLENGDVNFLQVNMSSVDNIIKPKMEVETKNKE